MPWVVKSKGRILKWTRCPLWIGAHVCLKEIKDRYAKVVWLRSWNEDAHGW